MSSVTNIILVYGLGEENRNREPDNGQWVLDPLNAFDYGGRGFVMPPGDHDWYGGTKCLEKPFFAAAFNYLRLTEFLEHVSNIDWMSPERVQVMIAEQHDSRYRMMYLVARGGVRFWHPRDPDLEDSL